MFFISFKTLFFYNSSLQTYTSRHEVSGIHSGIRLILGDNEPTRKSTHRQGIAKCSPHKSNPGRQGHRDNTTVHPKDVMDH